MRGCTATYLELYIHTLYEPGSKLLVLGMVIQPLIGNPYNGYINTYWVDDHPLFYGNIGSLDPSTHIYIYTLYIPWSPNLTPPMALSC